MAAYFVFQYDITNADGYSAYPPAAGATVYQYGGEVIAADPNAVAVEGAKPDNVVILKFESAEAAQKWYESPEYQAALPHRLGNSANNTALITAEFTPPS